MTGNSRWGGGADPGRRDIAIVRSWAFGFTSQSQPCLLYGSFEMRVRINCLEITTGDGPSTPPLRHKETVLNVL